jgi:hypothetical protein
VALSEKQEQSVSEQISNIDTSDIKSNADLRKMEGYEHITNDEALMKEYARTILHRTEEEISNMVYEKGSNGGTLKTMSGDTIVDDGYGD